MGIKPKKHMFNEDLKNAYIEYAISIIESQNEELYKQGIINRFIRSERLETKIGKDICEMNKLDAQKFLTEFLCGGQVYQFNTLDTLKPYVDWAIKNSYTTNKENAFDGIKVTDIDVSDSYTNTMVKDESDLIESLDTVLNITDSSGNLKNIDTADSARLCIFLLIFAGIPFKDLFFIKKDDVNLEDRIIMYGTRNIHISDILYTALNCHLKMDELQRTGRGGIGYAQPIIDEGYLISNTKSFGSNRDKMRLSYTSDLSKIFSECSKKLNPSSILDSGIFYRMQLNEKKTGEVDCLEYLMVRKTLSTVINYPDRVKKICRHEYETWKRAFDI